MEMINRSGSCSYTTLAEVLLRMEISERGLLDCKPVME